MTWAEATQCIGDRAEGPMALPAMRTDGISERKETSTEEETEAQREAGGGRVPGLVSLRLLSSGLSRQWLGAQGPHCPL